MNNLFPSMLNFSPKDLTKRCYCKVSYSINQNKPFLSSTGWLAVIVSFLKSEMSSSKQWSRKWMITFCNSFCNHENYNIIYATLDAATPPPPPFVYYCWCLHSLHLLKLYIIPEKSYSYCQCSFSFQFMRNPRSQCSTNLRVQPTTVQTKNMSR